MEARDALIDVLIKVIPKNKLAVELFVKIGGSHKMNQYNLLIILAIIIIIVILPYNSKL